MRTRDSIGVEKNRMENEYVFLQRLNNVSLPFLADVENHLKVDNVIEEAGSKASISTSKKVLKWWRKARVKRFIKKA